MAKPHLLDKINSYIFYRDSYRWMLYFATLLVAVCGILVGLLFYQRTQTPPAPFFATTSDGRIIEIIPVETR